MSQPESRAWIVIAGGGTAGHVQPALAIAEALVDAGCPREQVQFVGSKRGIETKLVPEAKFQLTVLPGRGIARRFSPANIGAVWGLFRATFSAFGLVRRFRPAVVVSVGGYAAVPCVVAAIFRRVPIVVAESNAVPGAANRIAGRFARASAVALPETPLRRAIVTGNPVRGFMSKLAGTADEREIARGLLGLPLDRTVVGIVGGSLGARRVNEAAFELVDWWSNRADMAIRHAVGKRDWELLKERRAGLRPGQLVYTAVEYEDHMHLLYAAADVVVARAGATTVAELGVSGRPSVLVPLPHSPGDHQTANARRLADHRAAVVVPDSECTGARLAAELNELLSDRERLDAMAKAAASLGRPDAAIRVADVIKRHASRAWA